MKKTLKITISIFLSVAFFYLFIKDVNRVYITHDSGLNHGKQDELNRVIFIADVNHFNVGDTIVVSSDKLDEPVSMTVEKLSDANETFPGPYIVTKQPIQYELLPEDNAFIIFPRLQRALITTNYWWLVPSLIATVIALVIRAYRWRFFLRDYHSIQFQSLWRSVCVGYMANNVLPFRIGEIVRAWFLARKEDRKTSEVFGTIVLERISDILSILILYVLFVFYFATQADVNLPNEMIYGAWIMAFIALSSLAFLILLQWKTEKVRSTVNIILKIFPEKVSKKTNHLFDAFVQGLWILKSWKCILFTFALSMLVWIVLAFAYLYIFYAVGIEGTLLLSLFLIVALAFAVSIPSAPGFIGTFHWVGQQALLMMGIKGNVEAYVLIAHMLAYIPVVVLGLFYLSVENISWKELKSGADQFVEKEVATTQDQR
jgi:glycosyltransferase 2 family protein